MVRSPLAYGKIKDSQPTTADSLQTVQDILSTPEDQIDLAQAKLNLDKIIDPAIDVGASLREIDAIAQKISVMAGAGASARLKLTKLRDYLFVSGEWNEHRVYQYDMSDPLGQKFEHKLLSNYLKTRLGNCVTMPLLFVILADRLGVHAEIAQAPLHFFVKYTDEATGKTFNLEITSGAHVTRDDYYRQKMPMTDLAIANGIYMRALSKKETLATMADLVLDSALDKKQYAKAERLGAIILNAYPNDVYAIAKQGSAYGLELDEQFESKYPVPADIPPSLLARYEMLVEKNKTAFKKAEALGWQPIE